MTTSVALVNALATPRAEAYGLGKPPPESSSMSVFGKRKESYEERVAAMRRAEEIRNQKDAELEDDAPLTTLRSGLQYREYERGEDGEEAVAGSKIDFMFKVYRLSSGAYFKFSSGGTPILLYGRGYGFEGLDDVGDYVTATLGATKFPRAVTPCIVGMRKGGVRRILVPPNLGWVDDGVFPQPDTFAAKRRMENYRDGPLLFEVEMVRVRNGGDGASDLDLDGDFSYRLPAPPTLAAR
jgi:FKBP-type peptidyl-prolyl cis-trans isomerase